MEGRSELGDTVHSDPPVAEVGSAVKPGRSQSVQCTSDGSVESGAIAHGKFLHNTDHSLSLDSCLPNTESDADTKKIVEEFCEKFNTESNADAKRMVEEFREEVRKKMKNLEDVLIEKTTELTKLTEERNQLLEKLDSERREKERNADYVRKLEEDKSKLESKVEALQKEVAELRGQIENSINHNVVLERQIKGVEERALASEASSRNNLGTDCQLLVDKLCAAIDGVVVEHTSSGASAQLEQGMKSAIQKASGVKGNGDYKNGTGKSLESGGLPHQQPGQDANNAM